MNIEKKFKTHFMVKDCNKPARKYSEKKKGKIKSNLSNRWVTPIYSTLVSNEDSVALYIIGCTLEESNTETMSS